MPRPKKKAVMSFALKLETLDKLRAAAGDGKIAGGRSAIVEDAVSAWLSRYNAAPSDWLAARGMAVHGEATDDL